MKREIGNTGVNVYPVGLGGMPMSLRSRPSESQSIEVVKAALDSGVELIDTADVYCIDQNDIGHNERLITKALKDLHSDNKVYIATKGGLIRPEGRWETDGRPEALRKACERSLKALETDSIFLYQLHAPDPKVSFEASVEELAKLKEEGKIQHVGLSNVSKEQLDTAQKIVRIESVQNLCNVFYQKDVKSGFVEHCRSQHVTYIPYSPVGGGGGHVKARDHYLLKQLAEKHQASPYCIMLAWLLHKSDNMLPIPGASKVSSIQDSARAASVTLEDEDIKSLDNI